MASQLNPYLNFNGTCRQAMEFYQSVFGGTLNTNTFAQFGQTGPDADRLMHAQLETDAGYVLMAADITSCIRPGIRYACGSHIPATVVERASRPTGGTGDGGWRLALP